MPEQEAGRCTDTDVSREVPLPAAPQAQLPLPPWCAWWLRHRFRLHYRVHSYTTHTVGAASCGSWHPSICNAPHCKPRHQHSLSHAYARMVGLPSRTRRRRARRGQSPPSNSKQGGPRSRSALAVSRRPPSPSPTQRMCACMASCMLCSTHAVATGHAQHCSGGLINNVLSLDWHYSIC